VTTIPLLPLALLAIFTAQRAPSDAGLRSTERAIAVVVSLRDPASVSPQIKLTPGGLTTFSYFFLRSKSFVIRDSNATWVEATLNVAPSGHHYTTREGAGVGTTHLAYSVRVRFGRRAYVVVSERVIPVDAYVWEAERFGVAPTDDSGRMRILEDVRACLEGFVESFDAVNGGPAR
jgi:hypothetical protein